MILVVGGTGRLGGSIARTMLDSGKSLRVLVRDGSSFDDARAETMRGDLKDPDSLRKACNGVDVVVTTANAIAPRQADDTIDSVDRLGNRNLYQHAAADRDAEIARALDAMASGGEVVPIRRVDLPRRANRSAAR